MSVDDERLMAYLDGELDALSRARVEEALAADEDLRRRLDVQRRLRARLAAHYDPVAQQEVPERFRRMLESNVVDLGAARGRQRRVWPVWQSVAALAATLVLGILLGQSIGGEKGVIRSDGGALYARGELAAALDTQLASTQPADAPTRVGVSFAGTDGRLCRTFEAPVLAGLACRTGDGWQLMVTAPGSGGAPSEYRQAASGGPLVLKAAQEMMAGEPLDAQAERRARDSGWVSRRPQE